MAKVGDMLQRDGDAALSTPSDTENGKLQMPTQPGMCQCPRIPVFVTDLASCSSECSGKPAGAQDCLDPGTIQLGATSQKARLEDRSWVLHFNFMSASTTQVISAGTLFCIQLPILLSI